jgi:DNA-binding MarR family transcriptional regulator
MARKDVIGFKSQASKDLRPGKARFVFEAATAAEQELRNMMNAMRTIRHYLLDDLSADDASNVSLHHIARREMSRRALRAEMFGQNLFSDPAWEMLLLLFSVLPEQRRLRMAEFSRGLGIPGTTVLRWLGILEERGLIERSSDPFDARLVMVGLTERGHKLMSGYFAGAMDDVTSLAALMRSGFQDDGGAG